MTNGDNFTMPVAPMGYGGGYGGFGGDGAWWLLILLFALGGGWGMGGLGMGGFGNMMLGYDFPWLLNGQQGINANTNVGLQNLAVQSDLGDIKTQLCNGFAGVEQGANARQLADMQQAFAAQTAMMQGFNGVQAQQAECCCENRLAIAGLNATIASEECATRANSTQNTQAILNLVNSGIQSIKDQLCQDKMDAKDDVIAQLRQENLYARGLASQIAQDQRIIDGIYNRLDTCPVGTTPVYGRTPIFTCNGNGCGGVVGGFNGTF